VDGLVPADRFFDAAPEVLKTLRERVAANSLELARHGVPKQPFYLTGQLDGQPFSVHREGDRVMLRRAEGAPEEVELVPPPEETLAAGGDREAQAPELPPPVCPDGSPLVADEPAEANPPSPGESPLDEDLGQTGRQSHGPDTQTSAEPHRQLPQHKGREEEGGMA
jgi:hypothetical protein